MTRGKENGWWVIDNIPPLKVSSVNHSHRVDRLGDRIEIAGVGRDASEYYISRSIELTDEFLEIADRRLYRCIKVVELVIKDGNGAEDASCLL